jgi:hypothetical protein
MKRDQFIQTKITKSEKERLHALCARKGWRVSTTVRACLALGVEHADELKAQDYVEEVA